ncbi:Uncharacterised protein [Mycobacterium tuberculosis]|nr:Uncharacterised protein [Mycobacterium tuberculosis]
MCQALVRADRGGPHLAGFDVVDGPAECEPAHAHRASRTHDALGVQAREKLCDRRVFGSNQRIGG